ncbi:MAG: glycosyl hydrolase family 65 protein [Ilumatobacter sp.]|uniref:glycoside hydrolase family 65 protein n=1 Tax=Ilumatobacter sp. TaxID=1967498 RepID=UPI0026296D78|nr:glycosyl hydrolase family 65 protein [Ilumatobacter sp.]MDJ0769498.1 glycosyl hydrolase family 65 protein [Ilumatobacter sp.]
MTQRTIAVPPEHLFPPDEWQMIERRWTPEFAARAETALALSNGYLGVRGCLDEGRPAMAPGTFINGFHETWPIIHAEEAYGLARVGQTIVNVPDVTTIELYVDDEPLFVPTARTPEYFRVLDMRNGLLTRDLLWSTPSGKHARLRSTRLVSLEHRHVIAVSYEVTLDRAAPVVIRSRVINRANPTTDHAEAGEGQEDPRLGTRLGRRVLDPRLCEQEGDRLVLGYRTVQSGMTLALAVDHVPDVASPHEVSTEADPDASEYVIAVDAEPDVPVRVVKYAVYQSSRSVPADELARRARHTLDRITAAGFEPLVTAQRACMDRFWDRADVTLEDTQNHPVRMQQAVRWNLYQLAQASWRAEGAGIPAKGLTGDAYDGHYFWDTETWVLPFLAYTQPRIARNLLRFRHSMLPSARARARELDLKGALFPWRTIRGDEASAYFMAGTAQYHLDADIAYAIRRYVDIRGDTGFIAETGAEILVETARMWADLGFYGDDGRFHIHGVTGPDEYTTMVDDNAFTNLMARLNLNYAASTMRRLEAEQPDVYAGLSAELDLQPSEPEDWERAAEQMYIPHDPTRGITPQDATFLTHEPWDVRATPSERFPLLLHYHPLSTYRRQVLKQADVVMAMFLLGNEFTLDQKRRNFDYYDPLTTGDSSLSASVQSIVASEIGNERAACRYVDFALLMDLADVAGNVSHGVHIASAAGGWMALVLGFGGVRDFDGELTIDPRLPERFRSLGFSLRFHDRQLRVALSHDLESYALTEGDPLAVVIRGEHHTLTTGDALELKVPATGP